MTDNLFDNFIKEKLQNYASPVPADMWDRIVQKKEKRRTVFWWKNYAIIGALLLVGLGGWFAMDANKTGKAVANPSSVIAPGYQSPVSVQPEANAAASAKKISPPATNFAEPANTSANAFGDNPRTEHNSSNSPGTIQTPTKTTVKTLPEISSVSIGKVAFSKRTKAPARNARAIGGKEDKEAINNEAISEAQSHFMYPSSSLLLAEKERRNFQEINLNLKPSFFSVDCPGTIDRSHGFYLEAYVSPDYSLRKVDAPLTEVDYLRRKDSMESRLASFTVGLRLSKNLGQNLVFRTGIQYSQINEKFSFRAEDERRLTTIVTIRTITHADGSMITVRDTSIIEQIGYRVKTSYNKYKSIDVPLLLGCEFGGEQWRGGFNLGAIINLSSWQQGETLDTSYSNTLPFSKDNQTIFKKHIGLGLYGSVNLIRSISPSFDVFAEPYFRYNFSHLTTNTSPFNQKFHVAGLLLGVRYNLNRQR